ncbi:MAG: hypothetical protein JSV64_03470 [Candidatus Bathyarchaeota archaeon]|nr:MAG: hypothetical protein JSV64_03470 [Candidatus Bathyarchaeota archaeon]
MTAHNKKRPLPIEKKLAAVEWKLELLKASIATTHTPIRTLRSMVQASVMLPARNAIQKITCPAPS